MELLTAALNTHWSTPSHNGQVGVGGEALPPSLFVSAQHVSSVGLSSAVKRTYLDFAARQPNRARRGFAHRVVRLQRSRTR